MGDVDLVIDGTNFFWVEKLLGKLAHLAGEENCDRTKKDATLKRITVDEVPVELYVSKPGACGGMWLFTEGPFWIDVCTTALMSDDGSDPWEGGDEEWDEESGCRCYECDFDGKVKDFQIENQEKTDE